MKSQTPPNQECKSLKIWERNPRTEGKNNWSKTIRSRIPSTWAVHVTGDIYDFQHSETSEVFIGELTKWCDKVGVRLQGFVVASILDVPHSQGFIIRRAHYELTARMEDETAHPIIVTNLEKMNTKS